MVRKYDPAGNLITSWGDSGVLDGSTTPAGPFDSISGLAVGSGRHALRRRPSSNLNGEPELFGFERGRQLSTPTHSLEGRSGPIGIGVDSLGSVYYVGFYEQTV